MRSRNSSYRPIKTHRHRSVVPLVPPAGPCCIPHFLFVLVVVLRPRARPAPHSPFPNGETDSNPPTCSILDKPSKENCEELRQLHGDFSVRDRCVAPLVPVHFQPKAPNKESRNSRHNEGVAVNRGGHDRTTRKFRQQLIRIA